MKDISVECFGVKRMILVMIVQNIILPIIWKSLEIVVNVDGVGL